MYYIDPGTGSMLFSVLIGAIGAGVFAAKELSLKIKYKVNGGKKVTEDTDVIPIAIFSDDKRYWTIFKPICDELERRKITVKYLTASQDDPALDEKYEYIKSEFIGEGNKAFAKLNFLKATILLSTTPGLDVYQWKRSKNVKYYVHIPHAVTDVSLYHMFGIDFYDALLLSGQYQIDQVRELEKIRELPNKEMAIVGAPYMDVMKSKFEKVDKSNSNNYTVLLAPSWGESAILKRFGSSIIDELIETGYKIIIRPHPQSFKSEKELIESLMKKYPNSEILEWNRDNDNFDVLSKSDILISDFSGVMFDFALVFDKPIIYTDTSFDDSPYDACWLNEEPWTFSTLRNIGQELTIDKISSIKSMIDECIEDTKYQDGRNKAREESWCFIGDGAKNVTDYLIEKLSSLEEEKE